MPDFSGLEGVELTKAQEAYAHRRRLAALERRLALEDEQDRALTAAMHEERMRYMEEAEQQFEDDAELLGSVQPLPLDPAALDATKAAVDALRAQAERDIVDTHALELEESPAEALVLDSIDLEEVRATEAALEAHRVQALQDESGMFLARIEALKRREAEAKQRAETLHADLLDDFAKRRALLGSSSSQWQDAQDRAFDKTQLYLSAALEAQKKLVTAEYGRLEPAALLTPDGRPREPPQANAPRILSLKVDCLRAIKNKLPGGFYVVLVTLYDHLGGHPIRWSALKDGSGIHHSAMTPAPQRHGGKFYNLELCFGQESNLLTLACPSLSQARPNNVLLFELVSVRGGRHRADRVVAWGAFPLTHPRGELLRGRFKVPLLRGPVDTQMDKYAHLSERLGANIDYWLCNLYFEATPIPCKAVYSWGGLRLNSLQYKIDRAALTRGEHFKKDAGVGATSLPSAAGAFGGGGVGFGGTGGAGGFGSSTDGDTLGSGGPVRLSTPNLPSAGGTGIGNPFLQAKGGRGPSGLGLGGGSSLGFKKTGPGGGKPDGTDTFILPSDLLSGSGSDLARKVAARERAKELRAYKHSITTPEADIPLRGFKDKARFVWAEVVGDLGWSRMGTLEFWSQVALLVICFWLRIYIHYFGQYHWIRTSWENKHAVYQFDVEATRCILRYQVEPLNAVMTEAMVMVVGVVSNQLAFLGLILATKAVLMLTGRMSDAIFRFLLAFGINTLLDPLLICLLDVAHANWAHGDYFKLFHVYEAVDRAEDLGYAAAFLTLALVALLMVVSLVLLLGYITRLHMDGRMLDVYHRLSADEGAIFVPNDLELSVRTLRYILAKSRKWGGFHGTRRQVLLTAYLLDDHMDRSFHERTLHLSIYNVTPRTGKNRPEQRDIFRHFVRTPDGALIEAFEGVGDTLGAEGYQKLEEKWLNQEAHSHEHREAEEEEMLKAMLSDQKRQEAAAQGVTSARARGGRVAAVIAMSDVSQSTSPMLGPRAGNMSVVRELSQERSELDTDAEDDRDRAQVAAGLGQIGESEREEEDEDEE